MALRRDSLRSLRWRTSDRDGSTLATDSDPDSNSALSSRAALATDPDPNSNATLTALTPRTALSGDRGRL